MYDWFALIATENERHSAKKPAVIAWGLYDLANTIFSMNIISLYMSLWVVNVMGGSDAVWGYANSFSMLLIVLSAPFLGALSDQAGRRLPFLFVSTLVCVIFTMLLGLGGLALSLVFFVIANYFFQAGLIFYDATLPLVSTPENRGWVGGVGVSLGYFGSFLGVGLGLLFLEDWGHVFVFRMTGLFFFLFAIPIFFFVKEPTPSEPFKVDRQTLRRAVERTWKTIRNVREYGGLGRFLVGRMFYADAINTLIVFLGVYVTNEAGFSTQQAQFLFLTAIAAAIGGGALLGLVVDRIGPKRTLNLVLLLWMITFAGAILIAITGLSNDFLWPIGCLAGISLGGTWAADRPYLLLLSPPSRVGEFYGLYSLVGRFAAVVGPAMWGFVAHTLGMGRPAAVATLLLMVIIAFVILQKVDDTQPQRRSGES